MLKRYNSCNLIHLATNHSLIEEANDLSRYMASAGFFVIHNSSGGGENDILPGMVNTNSSL